MKKITSEKGFKASMTTIDTLLGKATKQGGFHTLSKEELSLLADLSKQVEDYEDNTLHLMPIKPKSIKEVVEYKRVELGLTQAELAETLGMGAPKLSQILLGRRPPDVFFILALYNELKIDPEFILNHIDNKNGTISTVHGAAKEGRDGRFKYKKSKSKNSNAGNRGEAKASRNEVVKKHQHA